jgi:predicted AAA+ superfamily ATPase
MRSVSESLAGRTGIIELEGLTLSELHGADRKIRPVDAMLRGTLPELWEKRDLDPTEFYRSYVATYLERDLRLQLRVSSLRDFERFLRACALRSAQVLNKADLARDVGISPSTAGEWLSALEASNQIVLLEPWFSNRTKSLVKNPKLYLADAGLLCFLVGITGLDDLMSSPLVGPVWETFVCSELRRQIRNGERTGELWFWRDRTKEVDFVIHRGGRFELYDAKWTEHPDAGDASALLKVEAELPRGSVTRRGLISRAANSFPVRDGVEAMPITALTSSR